MEWTLGRDRDPFDRTVAYLRERLADWRPLQGAVISINGLAQTLDLSHTPVREALATLAGEGLIVRTSTGYSGTTFTPTALAGHYDLAELLAGRAIAGLPAQASFEQRDEADLDLAIAYLVELGGQVALRESFRRVDAQLAPFRKAAEAVLTDRARSMARFHTAWGAGDRRGLATIARGHYTRRKRAVSRILTAAIGLGAGV